jgi:hypothetical protein
VLFHLQFPFTDLRCFLPTEAPRVMAPSWPAPIAGEEFVRSFGAVRQRRRGGLSGWIAEAEYCGANRAVRFSSDVFRNPGRDIPIPTSAAETALSLVFRRLFFDGFVMGKIEIGVEASLPQSTLLKASVLPQSMLPIETYVARILALRAHVRDVNGSRETCRLHEMGRPLTRLYGYATSKVLHRLDHEKPTSNILSEAPLLFIEMNTEEAGQVTMPSFAREVKLSEGCPFSLRFWRTLIDGRVVWVWCSVRAPNFASYTEARSLRIFLLRLNAEHQALKRVLKAIGAGTIAPGKRDDLSQILQNYINEATRRILKCESKAQTFSDELDKLAFSVFDTAMPGERDALIERLHLLEMRGNIVRKVETYTSKTAVHIEMYGGNLRHEQR